MCGRFLLEPRAPQVVSAFFGLEGESEGAVAEQWQPRWNLAPTQDCPIVRRSASGRRELSRLRWGLVPVWSKDPAMGSRLINARAETVAEKPSFRAAWKSRRCIIPMTGWYEWQAAGPRKQPWLLRRADCAFTPVGGLWESWRDPASGSPLESFTIITVAAVAELAEVHDRMPLVLEPTDFERWLTTPPERAGELAALLQPPTGRKWERHPVSTHVNNPRHDAPACAAAISL